MTRRIALALVPLLAVLLGACGGGGSLFDGDVLADVPDLPTSPPSDPPTSPPTSPPSDPPTGTTMSAGELAKAISVFDAVNAERAAIGESALVWDDLVAETAYQHSIDMQARDYFAHYTPEGLAPWDRLDQMGVSYSSAGENIYWASWSASATDAMTGWMNSTGHRQNIERSGWTHTGIGVRDQGGGGSWWTQVFISR